MRWTKESYPYYGDRSEVVVDFPLAQHVAGLNIIQTGTHGTAHWSVSEIRLFRKK